MKVRIRERTMAFLICFTGLDGSGETTQAEKSSEGMGRYGIKNECVHNMFEPFKLFMEMGRAYR